MASAALDTAAAVVPGVGSATESSSSSSKAATTGASAEASLREKMQTIPTPMSADLESKAAPLEAPKGEGKRENCLSWDDYFMGVAFLTSMRSKDPSTQVGACIVNGNNRIVGVGYNGFPSGIEDDALPWCRASPEGELETKYPYVCHAELNAVMNKNVESAKGCRIFSTLFPCSECAKVIIQAGIKKVIYASDKHAHLTTVKASKRLFSLAKVEMVQHAPDSQELRVPLCYPPSTRPASSEDPQEGAGGYRSYEKQVDSGSFAVDVPPPPPPFQAEDGAQQRTKRRREEHEL